MISDVDDTLAILAANGSGLLAAWIIGGACVLVIIMMKIRSMMSRATGGRIYRIAGRRWSVLIAALLYLVSVVGILCCFIFNITFSLGGLLSISSFGALFLIAVAISIKLKDGA